VDYDAASYKATFSFPDYAAALPDGHYRATIASGSVGDSAGNALAGDYVIEFATATGGAGADSFRLRLTGDGTTAEVSSGLGAASTFTCPIGAIGTFLFQGMGGDDVLDFDGPFAQQVLFSGGDGTNTLNVNAGTFTFDADATGVTDNLIVNVTSAAASVQFNATQNLQALNIAAGLVTLAPGGDKMLVVRSLLISGGSLNLADNGLVLDYTGDSAIGIWDGSAYTGVAGMIQSGFNFNEWDGPGIRSSAAAATLGATTLGVGEARDVLFLEGGQTALWNGITVDATSVIVKYTYAGDANLDGVIDGADYGIIDNYIQFPGADGYLNGDFNYDGVIDGADYGLIDNAIQFQSIPL
jgi:hypothetical protein